MALLFSLAVNVLVLTHHENRLVDVQYDGIELLSELRVEKPVWEPLTIGEVAPGVHPDAQIISATGDAKQFKSALYLIDRIGIRSFRAKVDFTQISWLKDDSRTTPRIVLLHKDTKGTCKIDKSMVNFYDRSACIRSSVEFQQLSAYESMRTEEAATAFGAMLLNYWTIEVHLSTADYATIHG